MNDKPQVGRLRMFIDQLTQRASQNDKTFRRVEGSLLFCSGLSLAASGLLVLVHWLLAAAVVLLGVILGAFHVLLSSKRKERETGPLAEAVIATAEAMVLKAQAEVSTRDAATALVAMTGERDRECSARITAENSVTDLRDQLERERALSGDWNARWSAMLIALRSMNKAAEVAPSEMDLINLLESMLDSSQMVLEDAFGFDPKEKWTFSIFSREIVDGNPVMVRRIARARDPKEKADRRIWGPNQGFTGYAWHSAKDLVVPDRAAADYADKFHDTDPDQKAKDLAIYVSFAAIPIRIGDDRDNIVGVITATSDKRDRFPSNPKDPLALNTELLRQIAAIISVQIALRLQSTDAIFKSP